MITNLIQIKSKESRYFVFDYHPTATGPTFPYVLNFPNTNSSSESKQ